MRTLALLVCLLAACAPSSGSGPKQGGVVVTVNNRNWSDVVVYAVGSGPRVRLGMVTAMRTTSLSVPRSIVMSGGRVRFVLDPIGSNLTYTTDDVSVRFGQRVQLDVGHSLPASFVSVWG